MIPCNRMAFDSGDASHFLPPMTPGAEYRHEFADRTIRVYISEGGGEAYVDQHERASTTLVNAYVEYMARLGFMPMADDPMEDPYECQEFLVDGFLRMHYVQIEQTGYDDYVMPSLTPTAFGPYSMEIPAIDQSMLRAADRINRVNNTPPVPRPIGMKRIRVPADTDEFDIPNQNGRHRA